jgi:hypothetical protein
VLEIGRDVRHQGQETFPSIPRPRSDQLVLSAPADPAVLPDRQITVAAGEQDHTADRLVGHQLKRTHPLTRPGRDFDHFSLAAALVTAQKNASTAAANIATLARSGRRARPTARLNFVTS